MLAHRWCSYFCAVLPLAFKPHLRLFACFGHLQAQSRLHSPQLPAHQQQIGQGKHRLQPVWLERPLIFEDRQTLLN